MQIFYLSFIPLKHAFYWKLKLYYACCNIMFNCLIFIHVIVELSYWQLIWLLFTSVIYYKYIISYMIYNIFIYFISWMLTFFTFFLMYVWTLCFFAGRSIHTYFKIRRPKNVRLSFEGIVNRANSPFVLTLCLPKPLNHHSAEVTDNLLFCL